MPEVNTVFGPAGDFIKSQRDGTMNLDIAPGATSAILTVRDASRVEEFKDRHTGKPVKQIIVEFVETGMILGIPNIVNRESMIEITGQTNSDYWAGHLVELYVIKLEKGSKSESGHAIRIRKPEAAHTPAPTPAPRPAPSVRPVAPVAPARPVAAPAPVGGVARLGAGNAQKIVDRAAERGKQIADLREYLVAQRVTGRSPVLLGPIMDWPRAWAEPIQAWLAIPPAPASDQTGAGGEPPEDDIPF